MGTPKLSAFVSLDAPGASPTTTQYVFLETEPGEVPPRFVSMARFIVRREGVGHKEYIRFDKPNLPNLRGYFFTFPYRANSFFAITPVVNAFDIIVGRR